MLPWTRKGGEAQAWGLGGHDPTGPGLGCAKALPGACPQGGPEGYGHDRWASRAPMLRRLLSDPFQNPQRDAWLQERSPREEGKGKRERQAPETRPACLGPQGIGTAGRRRPGFGS